MVRRVGMRPGSRTVRTSLVPPARWFADLFELQDNLQPQFVSLL